MLIQGTIKSYSTTIADVANTAALTTFCSFTIPANDLADGNVINITISTLTKNNKGTDGTFLMYGFYGTDSVPIYIAQTVIDNVNEGKTIRNLKIMRVGADLWFNFFYTTLAQSTYWATPDSAYIISNPGFAADKVLYLKMQLDAADAAFYFKPQKALAYKIG